MTSSSSARHQARLIRQLQAAQQSLQGWDVSIRASTLTAPSTPAAQPSPAAVLLAIVGDARQNVNRRLVELGVESVAQTVETFAPAPLSVAPAEQSASQSSLSLCVKACRACGRSLGAAFREAQSVADAASARVLYGSIRALEKQLWVLDPCQVY